MTTAQLERDFDVVFSGRPHEYLCVFLPPMPKPDLMRGLPDPAPGDIQDRQGQNKQRVIQMMPGTAVELETRTGLSPRAVLAALNILRRKGELQITKERGLLTVYGLRVEAVA